MLEIVSNKEYLEKEIAQSKNQAGSFKRDFILNQDFETTVIGNLRAHQLNTDFNVYINQFAKCLEEDLSEIIFIAESFEDSDIAASKKIMK